MARLHSAVGTRVRVAALALALVGSIIPVASVYAVITVSPATGGTAISVDNFGTGNWTTLNGPSITEGGVGALAVGSTTILTVPPGFQFNPAVGNTSTTGAGCNLAGTLAMTSTTATYTVTTASTVATCVLTFVGLQVQPSSGSLGSGNILKSGTSAAPALLTNYGTLTKVPGAVFDLIWLNQPSPSSNGGAAWVAQPIVRARDQFGNNVPNVPVLLAITPGTGAAGAALTCTTNPVTTNAVGDAIFTGCMIDKAGSYTLRASSNTRTADSGLFVITVGPAAKLIFTAYPATNTPPLLSPQPVVAITDLGGNTVTTAVNTVTLAINQNPGTFSCTGGLSTAAVAGVATFTGCTQTTVASGYTLTASSTTPNPSVTGPSFAVSPPVLVFTAGPGSPIVAGQPFPTNIQVAIQNGGVTLTSGVSATVTLSIGTNPGGGTLTCTGGNSVGTISGVATFTGCSISTNGTGYTLVATATNVVPAQTIAPATSAPFNVGTAISPAVLSITTSCSPACPPDTTRTPPQANIKLPQNLSEGVTLVAQFAASGANRSVVFEVSKDQVTWSSIATVNSDASGRASTFYRPSDNRYYRAKFAGAGDLGPGMSPVVRVVVRSLIFIRPIGCTSTSPCVRNDGTTVTFTATARPNRPELPTQQVQFVLQRRSGSTYVGVLTEVRNVSKTTGTAVLAINFSAPGTYRLRANLLPTPVNANSFPTEFEYYRIT